MKKMKKYLIVAGIVSCITLSSCETLELDLTEDPNALVDEQADVDFYINSIQEDFVRLIEGDADGAADDNFVIGGNQTGDGLSIIGATFTRIAQLRSSRSYADAYQAVDADDEWDNAYRGILFDIRSMTPLAQQAGKSKHIGVAQFIEAYVMVSLVDFFGDVPYSQALQGVANLNPTVDSGASIYDAALALLDQAIVNFGDTSALNLNVDYFYNNNYTRWIRAANTLQMKIYLQRRLVDPQAITNFNNILASGNYISSTSDDFQFRWPATSASNPDTRHPRYGINYTATGSVDYASNWLMNLMDTSDDPRIRYYFYRQADAVPGAEIAPNEEDLNCSLEAPPQHYIDGGFTFCYLNNGYWGRDHMDNDGTPPDGFKRVAPGVYPVGGRFDDDSFEGGTPGTGGGGVGITPILTAAWTDFMIAEVQLVQNNAVASALALESGITKSIAKVMAFGALDTAADLSFEPTVSDVDDFTDDTIDAFEAASMTEKWDILGEQYFIALYGNGIESYNFYRRTGYPTTLQPSIEPNPGAFVRSLFYPANVANTNTSIPQKADQTQRVFWDTNPTAGFPVAN
jgi:Starch-binding associating with outer membrane/Susd and RagB outer membrane lipoprotein